MMCTSWKLLLFVVGLAASFQSYAQPADNETLRAEHEMLSKIVNTLSDRQLLNNKSQFLKSLTYQDQNEIDKGFGCTSFNFRLDNFEFTVLAYGTDVMQYVVNFQSRPDKKHSDLVNYIISRDTMLKNKVAVLGQIKKETSFSYINDTLFARFKKRVSDSLGIINSEMQANENAQYKTSYQTLIYPVYDYAFGWLCGYGQENPAGRSAIEHFSLLKDFSTIRSVMRGYNPEGRIYAVEALLSAADNASLTLTRDDIVTMKKVLSLNLKIATCNGCSYNTKKGREALSSHLLELIR
jgi:hypothetical protein